MPQFFETKMGQQFYDGTMRRVAHALESIATSLERLAADHEASSDVTARVRRRAALKAWDTIRRNERLDALKQLVRSDDADADTVLTRVRAFMEEGL